MATGAPPMATESADKVEMETSVAVSQVSMGGTVKIEEYQKDITNPEKVKAAVSLLEQRDERIAALEKKNKDSRAKSKKKKMDDDDDDLD